VKSYLKFASFGLIVRGSLATSHDCPMIITLADSENIPLIEVKRKILQGTTVPKDIVYDYIIRLYNMTI